VTDGTVPPRASRDTAWRKDGRAKGVYWRPKAGGGKACGFYNARIGRIESGCRSRQEAIDRRAKAQLDKSAGLPAPDTRVRIADLAEEVRETKRRRLRPSSFAAFEYALDKIVLREVGHLKPAQCSPDRVARLIRELQDRGLAATSIRRYLTPLSDVFKLAVRRGLVSANPMSLLSDDEKPQGGSKRKSFEWSPETISQLIAAAEELDRRPEARQQYAPIIHVLALTGLRVSEALASRWDDVDLLEGVLHVRHSLNRDGTLGPPKTKAGERDVPLSPGLADLLLGLKPLDASDNDFVFAGKSGRPLSYWNVRTRGFAKALEAAGLDGNGITIHDLRHAAASVYIAAGLSAVDVADVLGHSDASVTLKVYAHLFNRSDVAARIREAQASLGTT
jgi:integrase